MEKLSPIFLIFLVLVIFPSILLSYDCKEAINLYNTGTLSKDFNEKERFFKEALKIPCKDKAIIARIYNNLADTYESKGKFKEAIWGYKKAIELDPDLSTPYISLGDVYSKIGDKALAGKYYDKYLQMAQFKERRQIYSSLSVRSAKRSIEPVPSEELYFGFNEDILTEGSERQLQELIFALNEGELRSYIFQISGHTCDIGSDKYNQWLSERRAKRVKEWLVAHGYPAKRLITAGFGEKKPIADNSTEEGRRINRRVEIRVVGVTTTNIKRSISSSEMQGIAFIEEGLRLNSEGRYRESILVFEKALEICTRQKLSGCIDIALENLYLTYLTLGDGEKASRYLEILNKKSE